MITDERLAELESGWQQEAVTHRGHPADEYANTCEDTAAALRELLALRNSVRQFNRDNINNPYCQIIEVAQWPREMK